MIEEEEEAKPEVASRSDGDVAASVQAVVETHDEQPQVTALPVLLASGAIARNAAVQNVAGVEAMSEHVEAEHAISHSPEWDEAFLKIRDLLSYWKHCKATKENEEQEFKLASEMATQGDPVAIFQLYMLERKKSRNPPTQRELHLLVAAANKFWVPAQFYLSLYEEKIRVKNYFRAVQACWPGCQAIAEKEGYRLSEYDVLSSGYLDSFHEFMWDVQLARKDWPGAHRRVAASLLCIGYDEGRIKKACSWLESGAATGDAKAMLALGMMYEYGIGTAQNRTKALALYEKAADKGLMEAQEKLTSMYVQHAMSPEWRDAGLQTEGKTTSAYEWCLRAMKQGSREAKLQMAQWLATGNGVAKDVKAAFALCKEAADSGLYKAHLPLALMYVTGTGTEPDEDEASYHALCCEGDFSDDDAYYAPFYLLAMIHEGEDQKILGAARRFGMQLPVNKGRAFHWYKEAGWNTNRESVHQKVKELAAEHGASIDEEEKREWERYEKWYEKWKDEWVDYPGYIDVRDPEKARELVEKSVRTGTWKLSRGECITFNIDSALRRWTKYLPQALSEAHSLRRLDLSGNVLWDESADDLAQIIRGTNTLEVLCLRNIGFTEEGYRTIAAAMQNNSTLRRVDFHPGDESEATRLIRDLCARNRKLQKLWAEFKLPSRLTFMEVPTEISELLESALIHQDQKDGTQSASATRQRVLEMLMCLQPMVLQARPGAKTT